MGQWIVRGLVLLLICLIAQNAESAKKEAPSKDKQPFNIVEQMDKIEGVAEGLASKKWKENDDALKAIAEAIERNGDALDTRATIYTDLISNTLKKSIQGTHAVVAATAVDCLATLAANLGPANFKSNAPLATGLIIEKMKDKNPKLGESLTKALDVVYENSQFDADKAGNFDAMMGALNKVLKLESKKQNPLQQMRVYQSLYRLFRTFKCQVLTGKIKEMKELTKDVAQYIGTSDAKVRAAALDALGSMAHCLVRVNFFKVKPDNEKAMNEAINDHFKKFVGMEIDAKKMEIIENARKRAKEEGAQIEAERRAKLGLKSEGGGEVGEGGGSAGGDGGADDGPMQAGIDSFEMLDQVDIVSILDRTQLLELSDADAKKNKKPLTWTRVVDLATSEKCKAWKDEYATNDRRKAIAVILDTVLNNVQRIVKDDRLKGLITALIKVLEYDLAAVSQTATKALTRLVKGLRKDFGQYTQLATAIFEKFKDPLTSLNAALMECLETAFSYTTYAAISKPFLAALKAPQKNPSVNQLVSLDQFLYRFYTRRYKHAAPRAGAPFKELVGLVQEHLSVPDQKSKLKPVVYEVLGAMMSANEEEFLKRALAKEIREDKIKFEKIEKAKSKVIEQKQKDDEEKAKERAAANALRAPPAENSAKSQKVAESKAEQLNGTSPAKVEEEPKRQEPAAKESTIAIVAEDNNMVAAAEGAKNDKFARMMAKKKAESEARAAKVKQDAEDRKNGKLPNKPPKGIPKKKPIRPKADGEEGAEEPSKSSEVQSGMETVVDRNENGPKGSEAVETAVAEAAQEPKADADEPTLPVQNEPAASGAVELLNDDAPPALEGDAAERKRKALAEKMRKRQEALEREKQALKDGTKVLKKARLPPKKPVVFDPNPELESKIAGLGNLASADPNQLSNKTLTENGSSFFKAPGETNPDKTGNGQKELESARDGGGTFSDKAQDPKQGPANGDEGAKGNERTEDKMAAEKAEKLNGYLENERFLRELLKIEGVRELVDRFDVTALQQFAHKSAAEQKVYQMVPISERPKEEKPAEEAAAKSEQKSADGRHEISSPENEAEVVAEEVTESREERIRRELGAQIAFRFEVLRTVRLNDSGMVQLFTEEGGNAPLPREADFYTKLKPKKAKPASTVPSAKSTGSRPGTPEGSRRAPLKAPPPQKAATPSRKPLVAHNEPAKEKAGARPAPSRISASAIMRPARNLVGAAEPNKMPKSTIATTTRTKPATGAAAEVTKKVGVGKPSVAPSMTMIRVARKKENIPSGGSESGRIPAARKSAAAAEKTVGPVKSVSRVPLKGKNAEEAKAKLPAKREKLAAPSGTVRRWPKASRRKRSVGARIAKFGSLGVRKKRSSFAELEQLAQKVDALEIEESTRDRAFERVFLLWEGYKDKWAKAPLHKTKNDVTITNAVIYAVDVKFADLLVRKALEEGKSGVDEAREGELMGGWLSVDDQLAESLRQLLDAIKLSWEGLSSHLSTVVGKKIYEKDMKEFALPVVLDEDD